MEKEFYTKLIYEHKCTDDYGPRRIELSKTSWDMGLDELLEMFHAIAIGATWEQTTFEETLAEYLSERGWYVCREEDACCDDAE